jgi:hypothetical protein
MSLALDRAAKYAYSRERLGAMQAQLVRLDAANIAGDVVQCGVLRGGQVILARLVSPSRRCWLYDTFAGMTEPSSEDVKRNGDRAWPRWHAKKQRGLNWNECNAAEVKDILIGESVYDPAHVEFVIGDVCETLLDDTKVPAKIALLYLDTDWYRSTRAELEILYPRLVHGGAVIIDDYGHWLGARKATDEYFAKHMSGYRGKLHPIDYTAVCLIKG